MTSLETASHLADVAVATEDRMRYSASDRTPSLVAVPPLQFLMIDGTGDPAQSAAFGEAAAALQALSAELREMVPLYGDVAPLEALWWSEDGDGRQRMLADVPRDRWCWTVMIPQPSRVGPDEFERARRVVLRRTMSPAVATARLALFAEGQVAQLMHVGPYEEESPSVARLHEAIAARGLRRHGKHHEIYVGVPTPGADRQRIILRQPVA